MKKQLHILEGFLILVLILVAGLFTIKFIYKINHEEVKTDYMWNMEFSNLVISEGSEKGTLTLNDNIINLDVSLKDDSEFFEFTIDVTNNGSLKAQIDELNIEEEKDNDILQYTITYLDDTPLQKGDILNSHTKRSIKVRISYPKQKEKIYKKLNLKLSFNIKYVAIY